METSASQIRPGRLRIWAIRSALLVAVLIVVVGIGELAVRLIVPENVWRLHEGPADWLRDEVLGWVHKPNLDITSTIDGRMIHFRTNEDGITPPDAMRARTPGVTRIMLFGDSSVIGRWIPQDQTIHAHLERMLKARGLAVEVVNAAVPGYSTDQSLLQMERLVPLYRPDIVAYGLHSNDFGGNVSREAYRNAKPMFVLDEQGSLDLLPPQFRTDGIVQRPYRGLNKVIQRSALYRVLQPFLLRARAEMGSWTNRNLMGIEWASMHYRPEELELFDWKLLGAFLERMDRIVREQDPEASFFLYHHPDLAATWEPFIEQVLAESGVPADRYDRFALEKRLEAVAGEHGVAFCPVVEHFLAHQERGPFHLLPRDYHCNPAGYELTAELLIEFLIARGALAGPAPADTETLRSS